MYFLKKENKNIYLEKNISYICLKKVDLDTLFINYIKLSKFFI